MCEHIVSPELECTHGLKLPKLHATVFIKNHFLLMKAILTKNGNSFSKHQRIITEGPKSSILGPLFFNILLTLIWGWGGGGGGGGGAGRTVPQKR